MFTHLMFSMKTTPYTKGFTNSGPVILKVCSYTTDWTRYVWYVSFGDKLLRVLKVGQNRWTVLRHLF